MNTSENVLNAMATMIHLLIVVFGAAMVLDARAELTYPVQDCEDYQWQALEISTCTPIGDFRKYPALDCADPGWPEDYTLLRVKLAGPAPDYDEYLHTVSSPFIMCGPTPSTCYDEGCVETDVLQQIYIVNDLTLEQQLAALNGRAKKAIIDSVSDEHREIVTFLGMVMLGTLVDGGTLPTDYQGLNWQTLYDAIFGAVDPADPNPYAETIPNLREPTQQVVIRRNELRQRILDGTIQDGEIDLGWPLP